MRIVSLHILIYFLILLDAPHGHLEIEFKDVRVPVSNVILGTCDGVHTKIGQSFQLFQLLTVYTNLLLSTKKNVYTVHSNLGVSVTFTFLHKQS